MPALAAGARAPTGPLGHGRGLLAVDVGHAETAADAPARAARAGRRSRPGRRWPGRTAPGRRPGCPGGRGSPTNSTTPSASRRPVGRRPGGRPRRQPEAELRVLLAGPDELVGVGLDARGDPGQHPGRDRTVGSASSGPPSSAAGRPPGARAGRSRRRSRRRCGRPRRPGPRPAPRSTCCCRAGPAGRPGRRRRGRRGAHRRWRRRGTSPPRGPAGPWPRTGTPWWRRPRRRPRPPPPPGSAARRWASS